MSHTVEHHWVCDACGVAMQTCSASRPSGWFALGMALFRDGEPDHLVMTDRQAAVHLCPDCVAEWGYTADESWRVIHAIVARLRASWEAAGRGSVYEEEA